jgi:hypothetical protein
VRISERCEDFEVGVKVFGFRSEESEGIVILRFCVYVTKIEVFEVFDLSEFRLISVALLDILIPRIAFSTLALGSVYNAVTRYFSISW